jgi:hypothetical protein
VFIKNGPPPKGHPAIGRPVVEKGSLMKEDRGGWHKLCRAATDRLQLVMFSWHTLGPLIKTGVTFECHRISEHHCQSGASLHDNSVSICEWISSLRSRDPLSANWTQLWDALESTLASIPVEHFWSLVEFMPQRIEAVLRTKGDKRVLYTQCIIVYCSCALVFKPEWLKGMHE